MRAPSSTVRVTAAAAAAVILYLRNAIFLLSVCVHHPALTLSTLQTQRRVHAHAIGTILTCETALNDT